MPPPDNSMVTDRHTMTAYITDYWTSLHFATFQSIDTPFGITETKSETTVFTQKPDETDCKLGKSMTTLDKLQITVKVMVRCVVV